MNLVQITTQNGVWLQSVASQSGLNTVTSVGDKSLFIKCCIISCVIFDIWLIIQFVRFIKGKRNWINPNVFLFRVSIVIFVLLIMSSSLYYSTSKGECICTSAGICSCTFAEENVSNTSQGEEDSDVTKYCNCISTGSCNCVSTEAENCTKTGKLMSFGMGVHTAVNAMTAGVLEDRSSIVYSILQTIDAFCTPKIGCFLKSHFLVLFLLAPLVTASWIISALSSKTIESFVLRGLNYVDWGKERLKIQRAATASVVFLTPSQYSYNVAKALEDVKGVRLFFCNCGKDNQNLSSEMSEMLQNIGGVCLSSKEDEYPFSSKNTFFVNCGEKIDDICLTDRNFSPKLRKGKTANCLIFSKEMEKEVRENLSTNQARGNTSFFSVYDVLIEDMISRQAHIPAEYSLVIVGCGEFTKAVLSHQSDIHGTISVLCEDDLEYLMMKPSKNEKVTVRGPASYGDQSIERFCVGFIEYAIARKIPVTVLLSSDDAEQNLNRRDILQKYFSENLVNRELSIEVMCGSESKKLTEMENKNKTSIAYFGSLEGAIEARKAEIQNLFGIDTTQK